MCDDKVCEHCLIGGYVVSMMGKYRVFECEKNRHHKDLLAGFYEPCTGSHRCGNETRKIVGKGKNREWKYTFHPDYKLIPRSEMRKSEYCIRQEKEDDDDRKKKAERMRKEAMDLMCKAQELEKT